VGGPYDYTQDAILSAVDQDHVHSGSSLPLRYRSRGFEAATMPSFIRSAVAFRTLGADDRGQQEWRREWFRFEQYANEDGRKDRVEAVLAVAV
jgi:hypothetical protein